MFARAHSTLVSMLLGMACLSVPSPAAVPVKLSGAITGTVSDASGTPQMGATVQLFSRSDRPYTRVLTDERGEFKFLGLFPDVYSIRVTLASFLPTLKKDILVQPGMRSVLSVNLNNLFSSIQLAYPPVENGSFMSDEWKWVLRSAPATRPVLRFAEAESSGSEPRTSVFSETRGIVRVSAGEGRLGAGTGSEADLGTTFALATSLYGSNQLQVSGNLGYGSETGVPAAAFRTSFSRNLGNTNPEVSLTMRQLMLPGRAGAALAGAETVPLVRSMSADFHDRTEIMPDLTLDYGFTFESVTFLSRLNAFSPYARLSYSLDEGETVEFAYTAGNARPDLGGANVGEAELQRDLNSLGMFPRLSLLGSRPKIQRGEEYELTYSRKVGSRTYSISAHREAVDNATLTFSGPAGLYAGGDVLPDMFTGASTFNAGNYHSSGYTAAVTQALGENLAVTLIYGSSGALTAGRGEISSENPDELRRMIRTGHKHALTARVTGTLPATGTHMIASYQWTGDRRWVMPGNLYSTQSFRPMAGLNLYVRQPIPGLSGRIEATADLRNLLAQGYLPVGTVNGQRVLLVQTPRSFRGGFAFIF